MNTKQIAIALLCGFLSSPPAIADTRTLIYGTLSFDSVNYRLVRDNALDIPVRLPSYLPIKLYPVDWSDPGNRKFLLMLGDDLGCQENPAFASRKGCRTGYISVQKKEFDHQVPPENLLAHETFKLSNGITATYQYINRHSAGHRREIFWFQNGWWYGIELHEVVATKAQIIRAAESMSRQAPIKGFREDPHGED